MPSRVVAAGNVAHRVAEDPLRRAPASRIPGHGPGSPTPWRRRAGRRARSAVVGGRAAWARRRGACGSDAGLRSISKRRRRRTSGTLPGRPFGTQSPPMTGPLLADFRSRFRRGHAGQAPRPGARVAAAGVLPQPPQVVDRVRRDPGGRRAAATARQGQRRRVGGIGGDTARGPPRAWPSRSRSCSCTRTSTSSVVDKPAGLVVHPGAGNPDRTLQNALLALDPALAALPRAGIVHRLGQGHQRPAWSWRGRCRRTPLSCACSASGEVHREYEAICRGVMTAGGTVDAPIARHPTDRRADGHSRRRARVGDALSRDPSLRGLHARARAARDRSHAPDSACTSRTPGSRS